MAGPTFHVRRLSIAEILDEGFRLFRHGFGRFLLFQLILYVPTTTLLAYGIFEAGQVLIEMVDADAVPALGPLAVRGGLFVLGVITVQVVVGAIVLVATSRAVAHTYLGRAWTTTTILKEALGLSPRAVAVGAFLMFVFSMAFGVPMGIGAGIVVALLAVAGGGTVLIVIAVLFALALGTLSICGAVLLILRYGLSLVAVAVEGLSFDGALSRSVELMRGRYARGLALFIILVAINLLITSVLSAFLPTPSFEGIDPDELKRLLPMFIRGQVLSTILSQVAGIFVQIYTSICWTLFYFTARCESEAFDLSHLAGKTAEG